MTLSLSKKNVLSVMTMTLTMISLIAPADAQTTCASTSPECCWVVKSWKNMGKKTTVSSTNATACCNILGSTTQTSGILGVTCTSTGIVTEINWKSKSLIGSIPESLGNLTKLKELYLTNNPGLTGTFAPPCRTQIVDVSGTSVTISGCTTSCTSSSPECCWVVESWKKMGKTTSVDPTSATACCTGIPGVTCTSAGSVTQISWGSQSLSGSIPSSLGNINNLVKLKLGNNGLNGLIPPELGNLTNLERLALYSNQLSGPIPSSLGNLRNLKELRLAYNKLSGPIPAELGNLTKLGWLLLSQNIGLNGTFTPKCGTYVIISNTSVIICGCAAAFTPPTIFPPPETHADCLASGPALTLAKRTQAYGQVIGGYKYTCHVDSATKNPFADCTNSMAFLCNTADSTWNSDDAKRQRCRTAVNQMYGQMNSYWQEVRKECGQWPFIQNGQTFVGNSASSNCATANSNLRTNAFYIQKDLSRVYVTSEFTISQNYGLWSKVTA